jgi:Rrf2 family nitric oxide-sensitive transcriptional repressor
MLTKTSITATLLLVHLGIESKDEAVSLKVIARHLGVSPTYLMKIGRNLVRAGILRASRGATGGVVLNHSPAEITLLAIVEACQGRVLGDFCHDTDDLSQVCGLHRAGADLHKSITRSLSRWTLKDLLRRPRPPAGWQKGKRCLLQGCHHGPAATS